MNLCHATCVLLYSQVNYLFSKPHLSRIPYGIDYDSDDPDEDYEQDEDEEE